jgi:hypothetical protein
MSYVILCNCVIRSIQIDSIILDAMGMADYWSVLVDVAKVLTSVGVILHTVSVGLLFVETACIIF